MKSFSILKKNSKKDMSSFIVKKVAILGDTATQFLSKAIKGAGYDSELNYNIWEAEFDQVERQILDPTSELYSFDADVIVIFQSSHKLLGRYNKSMPESQLNIADKEIEFIKNLVSNIEGNSKAKIIYYNYTEIDDAIFGNHANKTEGSFLFQLRKLNYKLMALSTQLTNLHICDLSSVQNKIGKDSFFQSSIYINTEMVLSIDALAPIAYRTSSLISSIYMGSNKCVILDLDNTTWGGVIGDDGIENIQIGSLGIGKAFSEFQYWVKKLKDRGVIVAICSKNTESVAKMPFDEHPDMVLRLADIAVFIANWENKADNIRQIQQVLNIGFDSMVFLDDNPFERNIVRENIEGITVPELPKDPAEYLEYLYACNLFETVSVSKEDSERTKLYQIEASRSVVQKKFTNEDDFLKSLNMVSDVVSFNKFNSPRVAQLSQRSNQFNLRTVRYTDADIETLSASNKHKTFTFTLNDRFGENGLICVVILKKEDKKTLFIDTWFMSCRVLKRGMENFVLNTIVNYAKEGGIRIIKGEYISTKKNGMVENHYLELGFQAKGEYWELDINDYKDKKSFIVLN